MEKWAAKALYFFFPMPEETKLGHFLLTRWFVVRPRTDFVPNEEELLKKDHPDAFSLKIKCSVGQLISLFV